MKEEYIGLRFNKLVIVSKAEPYIDPRGHQYTQVNCICDCGNTRTVLLSKLKRGVVKSCGCFRALPKTRENLVGRKFGMLTVIAEGEPHRYNSGQTRTWVCKCECGTIKTILQSSLKRGGCSSNCGCLKTLWSPTNPNLTGNRYGHLTVLKKADKPYELRYRDKQYWECVCDCGKTTIVNTCRLRMGLTSSCGCLRYQMRRGVRFGKLVLLSPAPKKQNARCWNVKCDCGRIHTVSADVLFRAANVYCDCGNYKPGADLTGRVFGQLTVLMEVDPVVSSAGRPEPSWLCRCYCGREITVNTDELLNNTVKSCGCLKLKPRLISGSGLPGGVNT